MERLKTLKEMDSENYFLKMVINLWENSKMAKLWVLVK